MPPLLHALSFSRSQGATSLSPAAPSAHGAVPAVRSVHVAASTTNALARCSMQSAGPPAESYDPVFHCEMPVMRHIYQNL